MNRNEYEPSEDYDNSDNNNNLKADFEINELDSLSSIDINEKVNEDDNEEPLLYETNHSNNPTICQNQLMQDNKDPPLIERTNLPKYKQRKSTSSFNNIKLNKEKEAFYSRLSKPKLILKDQKQSYSKSKDNPNPNRKINQIGENACSRLYKMSFNHTINKEKLKREYEDSVNKNYPFTPQINKLKEVKNQANSISVLERFKAFEETKKQSLNKLIEEKERLEAFPYHPKLDEHSITIANQIKMNKSLSTAKPLITENMRLSRYNQSNDSEVECSFNPKLSISKISNKSSGNIKTFLQRYNDYAEESRQAKEKKVLIQEKDQNEIYTFKPKINPASEFLSSFINETPQEKYNRMSRIAHENIMSKKEKLKELYDSQYDYKPLINQNYDYSPLRGKSTSKTSKDCSKKSELEAVCYTFKPQINNNKYPEVQSQYLYDNGLMPRIESELKKREDKRNEYRKFLEEKEIEECVFSPEINQAPSNYNNTQIDIKGYDRYIDQMKQIRNRKQQEEELYQARFFTSDYCNQKALSITKPQPFNLSTQHRNHHDMSNYRNRLTSKDQ